MRNRFLISLVASAASLPLCLVPAASSGQQTAAPKAPAAANKRFDAHDLNGFWDLTNIGLPPGALNETSNNRPPLTDWAKALFSKTKTGYKEFSSGAYPAQKDWNDPTQWCDPMGFPRILWNPTLPGMRMVQTPGQVIQLFESGRAWRDVWTDGRKLPADGEAEPRWYGYAVGKWDGDTFVVNSNNYMDKTWLDQYGSPHSDEMTIQERYRRPDRGHLELFLDITDPKAYAATWKGDKKTFVLVDKLDRSDFNDFGENLCVWSEAKIPPKD